LSLQNQISKMDLLEYFAQYELSSYLSLKDKVYDKIVDHLDEFIKNMLEKDKQMLIQIMSNCYFKYRDSITKDDNNSIMDLNIKMLMKMSLDQKIRYSKA
jgi:hypothetical protein